MDNYVSHVNEAVEYIQRQIGSFQPKVALTLGSGLGKVAKLIDPVITIPYEEVPHFPTPTVVGHEGKMIIGTLQGVPVIGLQGRKHFYEVVGDVNGMDQVVFPVHVAASLGCEIYAATNAAGGLNSLYTIGDVMLIRSHIGLFIQNPLLGSHHNFGNNLYFQPQNEIYSISLRTMFKEVNSQVQEGVYVCLTGRTYETQAECLALRSMGADAVGMSTVPEIIIAANRGMKTIGLSVITNVINADGVNATNHKEVVAVLNSQETENKILSMFTNFFERLRHES